MIDMIMEHGYEREEIENLLNKGYVWDEDDMSFISPIGEVYEQDLRDYEEEEFINNLIAEADVLDAELDALLAELE